MFETLILKKYFVWFLLRSFDFIIYVVHMYIPHWNSLWQLQNYTFSNCNKKFCMCNFVVVTMNFNEVCTYVLHIWYQKKSIEILLIKKVFVWLILTTIHSHCFIDFFCLFVSWLVCEFWWSNRSMYAKNLYVEETMGHDTYICTSLKFNSPKLFLYKDMYLIYR